MSADALPSAPGEPSDQPRAFWTPANLAANLAGRWLRPPDDPHAPLAGLSIDTRTLQRGQAFLAIPGPRFDGHDFLDQAFARGAALAIVTNPPTHPPAQFRSPTLQVHDPVAALHRLAKAYRRLLQHAGVTIIAVAGSNGKTTTRRLIHTALHNAPAANLSRRLRGTQSPASFNNHLGVPLTLLAASPTDDFLVLEIGTNHPGEVAALAALAKPRIAVITSIGCEHLQFFHTLAAVAAEQAALLDHLAPNPLAIIQDHALEHLTSHLPPDLRVITYGEENAQTVVPSNSALMKKGPEPLLSAALAHAPRHTSIGQQLTLVDGLTLDLPLCGRHNALNALAAITVARHLGLDDATIARQLAQAAAAPGRFERRRFGPVTVIHDAYNANPDSMAQSLSTFAALPLASPNARRIAVLGDMLELGRQAPDLHRRIGRHILNLAPIDQVILIGPLALFIAQVLTSHSYAHRVHAHRAWSDDLPRRIAATLVPGDTVLLKASRALALERLLPAIEAKFAPHPHPHPSP